MNEKIDFVVTWVDGSDEAWLQKKRKYEHIVNPSKKLNSASRYRDYEIFKYWFRAVEVYAPWVNHVFLITDNQIPDWLDTTNPKLICVSHTDYIEHKFLPTFNSNVIELSIANIKELSEHFVLFNDDIFVNAPVNPTDFFVNGLPRETYAESPIVSTEGSGAHIMVNDMQVINIEFDKRKFYRNNFSKVFNYKVGKKLLRTIALAPSNNFVGMWNTHLAVSYRKHTFVDVWNKYRSELTTTLSHKFRTPLDYNHWLMRYWQLASGKFEIQSSDWGRFYQLSDTSLKDIEKELRSGKHKVICLNDTDDVENFEQTKHALIGLFESKLPNKSSFEK
ncbi:stealth family protein [Lactiplantibacillus pentosus]|uniref:Glycosyltransferase n=1 Tax=Lactiplantibacillus pentosus DSM 20314 TaxID=1423791 RepID=A0A837RF85_LACPE|nr:stealth family protein [Lactiplantibacillus pentosus]AYJ41424.1 capsule biosynthesis protein CapG [Lactiplantibacillus pentosus]KRK26889.1 glycosyltransferase [Lactiplantibacillus pentosus DSM 20314]MCT3313576.1 capsule biosynthesis protein CapG [Lactiplantibacillus pentosus]PKX55972.1 capsule biosynthesis protein CapG [Lactiplantibacillus pentosus]TDG90921.1 hypothetical protein C5L29_001897 [Lactiplantibacillus pentosus]